MLKNGTKLAYALALSNAAIVGFSFLFTKVALSHASPFDTLAYRFIVAFAVMSIPVVFGWVKLDLRGKPLWKPLVLALSYPLSFFTFQSFGLQYASSAEGGILFAFGPVLTTFLAAIFLKEATTPLQKLSIAVSVSGVVYIFIAQGGGLDLSHANGLILLCLSAVASSGYAILARLLLREYRPLEITYVMLAISCFSFTAIATVSHALAGTLPLFLVPARSGGFIGAIMYLGVLSSMVTALSSNYALSKLEASKMSVFTNLSTIVSIIAGALLLGERIAAYHVTGSALIIVGVLGTVAFARKPVRVERSV